MNKDEIRAANLKREVHLHVMLDGSMDEALNRASEESGNSRSTLVRRALQQMYTCHARSENRIVGSSVPVFIPGGRETR